MITYFDLLVPLGLLGLLGVLALIIIYIIRPNYQVKHVSSTFVWKLSLRYRRKRPPTSKLRNILIFLCQVLALTSIAGILAMPAIVHENEIIADDVIAIIDTSASMNTLNEGESRFQRAVDEVIQLSDSVFSQGGSMSVIMADDTPSFLGRRVSTAAARLELSNALDELLYDDMGCAYGSCNIDATMELCEEVLSENPSTKIYFYTDTTYLYVPEGIEVVPITNQNEWNAAILNATATLEDGYYVLTVEVATYGQDIELELNVQVTGANPIDMEDVGTEIEFSDAVFCNRDTTKTFVFRQFTADMIIPDDENLRYYDLGLTQRFYSFSDITISINEMDSFREDNNFYIYGGRKEPIKIQYSSSMSTAPDVPGPNPFVNNILGTLKKSFSLKAVSIP